MVTFVDDAEIEIFANRKARPTRPMFAAFTGIHGGVSVAVFNQEVVLDALAFDDIDESGVVAVLLNSCDCEDDERVPAIDHKFGQCTRWTFTEDFCLEGDSKAEGVEESEEKHEDEMIVSFIFNIDPKISYVPVSIRHSL